MRKFYIALLRKEPDSCYGVDFPDFPGCITAGDNAEEAQRKAEEALQLHIEGMVEDGDEVPEPSSLDEVLADPENEGALAVLVEAPVLDDPAVKITLDVPKSLLERIDTIAKARKLPGRRSGFIIEAARRRIKQEEVA
ncbi:MAG: type II toxin-antitoxin system HicB family antitoxin [Rhodovibrionaceae bacterium]